MGPEEFEVKRNEKDGKRLVPGGTMSWSDKIKGKKPYP